MYLVTGGLGVVGAQITKMLLDGGHDVTTFSRSSGEEMRPFFSNSKGLWHHVPGSLERSEDVVDVIAHVKPKTIFHIGGMLSIPSENNPRQSFNTNIVGMFELLDAARTLGVEQVLYASTNGTYGLDLDNVERLDDATLQRPFTIYGVTKVTGELLGRYFKRKYGLDFRAIRLPAVVGPGSKVKHVSVYNAWAIEHAILGKPYDIFVSPETRCPIVYYKDAARAFIDCAAAPVSSIKTVCYNMVGIDPIPTAALLRERIITHIPSAKIGFAPEELAMNFQKMHQRVVWDDSKAKQEWGWKFTYDLDQMILDFIEELKGPTES